MNNKDVALVVLAAGMGSRYGGLKQMDAFGPSGESIIDYSVYDAIKAGFTKIIFVIRKDFHEIFENQFRSKIKDDRVTLHFVDQELSDIPHPEYATSDRVKPWGTGHALWACRSVLDCPFAVINGDDFYGFKAFQSIYDYLSVETAQDDSNYVMVAYQVQNTLSDNGTVSRGVCELTEDGTLQKVTERTKIARYKDDRVYFWTTDTDRTYLADETPVSMNFWGMHHNVFNHIQTSFADFIKERGQELKSEYYLPLIITELLNLQHIKVAVEVTDQPWFGVTYPEDKQEVKDMITHLVETGEYGKELWG